MNLSHRAGKKGQAYPLYRVGIMAGWGIVGTLILMNMVLLLLGLIVRWLIPYPLKELWSANVQAWNMF